MMRLSLYDTVGVGLIFKLATGLRYSNQAGGTSCLHPHVEGAYISLGNDYTMPGHEFLSAELALTAYFEGPKHLGAGAVKGLDRDDADVIDKVLEEARIPARVDRSALASSMEAWVHVCVQADDSPPRWEGTSFPAKAVLVWSNSD